MDYGGETHWFIEGNQYSGYQVGHGNGYHLYDFPNTQQAEAQARGQCAALNAGVEKKTGSDSSSAGTSSSTDGVVLGAAIGASAALVGFGLKGIWKIIVFPFWLMFWMFKLIFQMFKGLFYTFPKFLWRKGTAGKIACGAYLFAWTVAVFIEGIGKAYILRNWIYLAIVLVGIIATAGTTLTFRLLDKRSSKRFVIALSCGISVITITILIGMVFTKHLMPLDGEIIPIEERYKTEEIQAETVEEQIQGVKNGL